MLKSAPCSSVYCTVCRQVFGGQSRQLAPFIQLTRTDWYCHNIITSRCYLLGNSKFYLAIYHQTIAVVDQIISLYKRGKNIKLFIKQTVLCVICQIIPNLQLVSVKFTKVLEEPVAAQVLCQLLCQLSRLPAHM